MSIKLAIGKAISLTEYNLRHTEAEVAFKAIMTSYNEKTYRKALDDFEQTIVTAGWFKDDGKTALSYLKDV